MPGDSTDKAHPLFSCRELTRGAKARTFSKVISARFAFVAVLRGSASW
jgi:hypothetical protein